MKIRNVYLGLLVFSLVMFVCAIAYVAYNGISEGRSLFIQILPILVFGICSLLFNVAYRKAVKREEPLS